MVPVAVYRGTPVRRYLWSGGNVGTISSAVQVGKLETGKKKANMERKLEQTEFCFGKLNLSSYLWLWPEPLLCTAH